MTLATKTEVKQYLRLGGTTPASYTAEDTLLDSLIARAKGKIEQLTGKSILGEEVTWVDDAESLRTYGAPTRLVLVYTPIDADSLVITDRDSTVIDAATYDVRQDIGMVVLKGSSLTGDAPLTFNNGPYRLACTAGLAFDPNYADRIEPIISGLIVDLVTFYYQQRTPGASAEGASGTRVDWGAIDEATGLPRRIVSDLRKLRGPVVPR